MAGDTTSRGRRRGSPRRIAAWAVAGLVLLLPLAAMQFTDEVNWDEGDFVVAGALIGGTGLALELAARATANRACRAAVGVALAAASLLVWLNLAVGIIGPEDNPLNLLFGGVLAVGIVGAIIARFRPDKMARALFATALAQTSAAVIVLIAGSGSAGPIRPGEVLMLSGFFAALWLLSAWLFRKAAREQTPAAAAP